MNLIEGSTRNGAINCIDICLRKQGEARARIEESYIYVLTGKGLAINIQAIHEHEPCIQINRWQRCVKGSVEVRVCFTDGKYSSICQARDLRTGQLECHDRLKGRIQTKNLFNSIR